jgi:hypothetical protein
MNFIDWFDPNNKGHLEAFDHLSKTGFWPEDFIPSNVLLSPVWQLELFEKIAKTYVEEKLNKNK